MDVEYNHAYPDDLQVVPFIDRRSLYEIAREVELPSRVGRVTPRNADEPHTLRLPFDRGPPLPMAGYFK